MRVRRSYFRSVRAEPEEVDDFKNAQSVKNEEGDEPLFLPVPSRVPKGIAFDGDCPNCDKNKKRHERGKEFRCKRGVKWREILHIHVHALDYIIPRSTIRESL